MGSVSDYLSRPAGQPETQGRSVTEYLNQSNDKAPTGRPMMTGTPEDAQRFFTPALALGKSASRWLAGVGKDWGENLQELSDEVPWPISPNRKEPTTPNERLRDRQWQRLPWYDKGANALHKTALGVARGVVEFPTTVADPLVNPEDYQGEGEQTGLNYIGRQLHGLTDMVADAPAQAGYLAQEISGTPNNPITKLSDLAHGFMRAPEILTGSRSFDESKQAAVNTLHEAPESLAFAAGIGRGVAKGVKKLQTPKPKPAGNRLAIGYEPSSRVLLTDEPTGAFRSEGQRFSGLSPEVFSKEPTPLKQKGQETYLSITREKKARTFRATDQARRWERRFTEREREDAGALIENVENLRTGEAPQATPKVRRLVEEYRKVQERARTDVNEYLKPTGEAEYIQFLENYLPHFYTGKTKQFANSWVKHSPNAKARSLPTLKDAVEYGLKPVSQDVAFLHKKWAEINWQVATNRRMIHELRKLKAPDSPYKTKLAIVQGEKPGPGWEFFDHPAIRRAYSRKRKDGTLIQRQSGVWVHPDLVQVAKKAFQEPYKNRGTIGRLFDSINSFAKSGELMLSGFHFFSLGESGQAVLASTQNPLRGLFIAGKEARSVAGRPFELTFRAGKKLQEMRPDLTENAIRDGLEIGSAKADIGYNHLSKALRAAEARTAKIPILKHTTRGIRKGVEGLNKALWEQVHEGYKVYAYHRLVSEELPKLSKDVTPKQAGKVRQEIANFLNDAFGGQEWESKFWTTPTGEMYARRILLAPDWTKSNLSIFARLGSKSPRTRRLARRYWRNMALSVFGATQAINYASAGHFTWENEPGHKLDIDVTVLVHAIDKVLGRTRKNPKQRYYVRIAKQAREVLSYFQDPLAIAGNKLSPIARETFRQVTGHGPGGGFPADWSREDLEFWESIPSRFKSIANMFTPFSLRGNNFAFSLPMAKGMTPYKAIKYYQKAIEAKAWVVFGKPVTDQEAIREITKAAVDNGLDAKQLYTAAMGAIRSKYYDRYFEALRRKDQDEVNEVARRLVELGVTRKHLEQSGQRRGANR